MMKRVVTLFIFVGLSFPMPASSTIYYVAKDDPECSDTNNGTSLAQPWCTIGKANTELQPGDTVYLRAGTYAETIRPDRSGENSLYITYTRFDEEEIVITGVYDGVVLGDRSYIVIDGIKILNVGHTWIVLQPNGHHNIIKNCHMEGAGGWSGINIKDRADYNSILNNTMIAVCNDGVGGPADSINLVNSRYNLIEGNQILYATHTSIGVYFGGDYTIIRNNEVSNPWHSCISTPSSDYILMENNVVLDCGDICEYDSCLANECGSERDRTQMKRYNHNGTRINSMYSIVRNNTVINSGQGFTFGSYTYNGTPITSSDNRIYNNTWSGNYRGIYVNNAAEELPVTNHVLKNNLMANNIEYELWVFITGEAPRDNYYINNNMYGSALRFQNVPYDSLDELEDTYPLYFQRNLSENPMFVDEAGRDLRLREGSPMIDSGVFLTKTSNAGTGTAILVDDSRYFMDGWGIIEGDLIQLEGQTQRARITHVDYDTNTITVDTPMTWTTGRGVSLAYEGSAPDIGAYEHGSSIQPTCQGQGYQCCDASDCQSGRHAEYDGDCPGQICCEICEGTDDTCADLGGTCCDYGQGCEGGSFQSCSDCGEWCCVGGVCYTIVTTQGPPPGCGCVTVESKGGFARVFLGLFLLLWSLAPRLSRGLMPRCR